MNTRELFESRFPVPENVSWAGDSCYSIINRQLSDAEWDVARIDAALHTSKWIGFQAGWEARGEQVTWTGPNDAPLSTKEDRLERLKCKRCVWTYDEFEDAWDTGCGNLFSFIDGSPEENKFKFCCYCGGNLTENKEGREDDRR